MLAWRKGGVCPQRRTLDEICPELERAILPPKTIDEYVDPVEKKECEFCLSPEFDALERRMRYHVVIANWATAIAFAFFVCVLAFIFYEFKFVYDGNGENFGKACRGMLGVMFVSLSFFDFLFFCTATVFGLSFLHAFWSLIPKAFTDGGTPKRVVFLLLIPVVNLYWLFIAFTRGSRAVNKALFVYASKKCANGERPRCVNDQLAQFMCSLATVLSLTILIQWQFVLFGLPFLTNSMKNAASQLAEWRYIDAKLKLSDK